MSEGDEDNTISGRIEKITALENGRTQVTIGSTIEGGPPKGDEDAELLNQFYSPEDLTADQLAELKKAHKEGMCVKLVWKEDDKDPDAGRVVESIRVFKCPE